MGTNNTPPRQYNVFPIVVDDESEKFREVFTAEITDCGIHLDHNFMEGGLFISHEDFEDLNEYREEFLDEIEE